eukprot:jgi/Bigna1/57499/fgenesh1_pm.16_\
MEVENVAPSNSSIEKIYQKKTPLEHILLRPDTYVGSIEPETTEAWVYDDVAKKMVFREITFVPGMYKIFDEILVNAADNKQRDPNMRKLEVNIEEETGEISVFNDGRGIPVQIHSEHGIYVPELIFGHLLTSSNYNDNQKKTTGGRNGFGAKLTNIYSTEFIVETADKKKRFKQTFSDNMGKKSKPSIKACKKEWTRITFTPDYSRFGMHEVTSLDYKLSIRVYDMAGCLGAGVKCYLNGELLKIKNFKEYATMYVQGKDASLPLIYERFGSRWEVAISMTEGSFRQISFVNSINTMKGGQHVNYISEQVVKKSMAIIKKKHKGLSVKNHHIKNHLWVFVNCLVENPAFDSQTKLNLTTRKSNFGSKCELNDKFIGKVLKCGILEHILSFAKYKQSKELKKTDGKRKGRIMGIPKLSDANHAGGRKSSECTLILTEGDSAKALALSGMSVVGRDFYGVFPLKGKLLNVRDAPHKRIMQNVEVSSLKKIIGLQQGKTYTDTKELRYGRVMIMADQDHDGSHIKGLVINLFSHFWPSLFKMPGFLVEFITPIVKCTKGKKSVQFFTVPEYESWKHENNDGKGWKIKYYKGLGTSTPQEAKEYFSDLDRHVIEFEHEDEEDDEAIDMVFAKNSADKRKEWLQDFKVGTFLAQEDVERLRYKDFVNKEMILFSMESNLRAIPSVVDGLKPGQRKIIYSCFKRNLKKEIKVAQLAGYVSEHSAYHHGEMSLTSTIVKMAQSYVGSNNINLLMPNGQFGTRYDGGKDAASPRYIFTNLSPVTRAIFNPNDDNILSYLNEDGQSVEPLYYVPVLPMVLVNGAQGMGTGWSTAIPNFNPREICENLKRLLRDEDVQKMKPWYKGFTGSIEAKNLTSYTVKGVVEKLGEKSLKITELPIGVWTQVYKEFLEKNLAEGKVKDFKEHHTDNTVSFQLEFHDESKLASFEKIGLSKSLKLTGSVSVSNMVLFDANGQLRKYAGPEDILREFYDLRLSFYGKRKEYLLNKLSDIVEKLQNKVRFVKAVIDGDVVIQRKKKNDILEQLIEQGYRAFNKSEKRGIASEVEEDDHDDNDVKDASGGYDYLLGMKLWSLTYEKIEQLEAELREKGEELDILERTPVKQLWINDIDDFLDTLGEHEAREKEIEAKDSKLQYKSKKRVPAKSKKTASRARKGIKQERNKGMAKKPISKKNREIISILDEDLDTKQDSAKEDDVTLPLSERLSQRLSSLTLSSRSSKDELAKKSQEISDNDSAFEAEEEESEYEPTPKVKKTVRQRKTKVTLLISKSYNLP